MLQILMIVNGFIFLMLSLLHVYWALGGNLAIKYAVPASFQEDYFNPKLKKGIAIATLVVAFGLMKMAILNIGSYWNLAALQSMSPIRIVYIQLAVGFIFLFRAIGDFGVAGFFKKETSGLFAKYDSKLFSPLCLFLASSSFIVAWAIF